MEAPKEEDSGSSGLGAFFGRIARADGGGGGGSSRWDSDAARRRRQAEELVERGILVGEFAEGAQAQAVRNAPPPHQDPPTAMPFHHHTALFRSTVSRGPPYPHPYLLRPPSPHPYTTITPHNTQALNFLSMRRLHWSAGCKTPISAMQPSWHSRRRDDRWRSLSLGTCEIPSYTCGAGALRSAVWARPTTGNGARLSASALTCLVASRLAW